MNPIDEPHNADKRELILSDLEGYSKNELIQLLLSTYTQEEIDAVESDEEETA